MTFLKNFITRKGDAGNMIPGTYHRGFEVIRDNVSNKWAIVLPTRYNNYTIEELYKVLDEYYRCPNNFCIVEVGSTNMRFYPGPMGDSTFYIDRIVDSKPTLVNNYTNINPTDNEDTMSAMRSLYQEDKDIIRRMSFDGCYITFNLPASPPSLSNRMVVKRYASTTGKFITSDYIDIGIVGFRTTMVNGIIRMLCPDVVTAGTKQYLEYKIIEKYLSLDDPNWHDYPSLVNAEETGISPLGLINISVFSTNSLSREQVGEMLSFTEDVYPV